MTRDQRELLLELNARNVRFVVIGGFAYSHYTEPRATKDLDVFVSPDLENANLVFAALASFGAPLQGISPHDFQNAEEGFQVGLPPNRIDILNHIDEVTFDEAWQNSVPGVVDGDIPVRYIGVIDFVRNKRAVGRLRDLADIEDVLNAQAAQEHLPLHQTRTTS